MLHKILLVGAVLGGLAGAAAAETSTDWRQGGELAPKVERLVEALPNAANVMIEMGARYQNLYWAAKLGKWDFAGYQAEEIRELIEKLQITRPKRAATAGEFLQAVYPMLPEAVNTRDWKKFEAAFEKLRHECMACHGKNEMGFVQLPLPRRASSPVLNME